MEGSGDAATQWVCTTAGGPVLRERACFIIGSKETHPVCAPGVTLFYQTITKPPFLLQGDASILLPLLQGRLLYKHP